MSKPNLYAVLVGINEYKAPVRQLYGCHRDVGSMVAYLKSQSEFFHLNIHPPHLDGEATKTAIVKAFQEHLGQAGPGDVVLFYFSGHGAREEADAGLWKREDDRLLECILCYNTEGWDGKDIRDALKPSFMLADKELRFLIWEVHQRNPDNPPHIVVISDCCHSGDNTRASIAHAEVSGAGMRRTEIIAKPRKAENYIFDAAWWEKVKTAGTDKKDILPQGAHVQLAACQDRQLAKEDFIKPATEKAGVFTTFLLRFLEQNGGNLTYYDLHTRLKNYTRFRYEQIPQVYIPSEFNKLQHAGFLNRPIDNSQPVFGRIHHDDQKGWYLDVGALHGVSRRQPVTVPLENGQIKGAIAEVQSDMATVTFEYQDGQRLDPGRVYPCTMEGFLAFPLNLQIRADPDHADDAEGLADYLKQEVRGLNVVEVPGEDIFTLYLTDGTYCLSTLEDPFRPVVKPIPISENNSKVELVRNLKQIGQWLYTRELQSDAIDRAFPEGPPIRFEIQLKDEAGNYQPQAIQKGNLIELALRQDEYGWGGNMNIKFTNTFSRRVWVSALYLSADFAVDSLTEPAVKSIEPGETLDILQAPIRLEDHFLDYNWKEDLSVIKIIVSTRDDLNVAPLLIETGLPMPVVFKGYKSMREKGLMDFKIKEEEAPQKEGWITQTLTIRIPNPEYNRISENKLKEMLKHPAWRKYAQALYVKEIDGQQILLKEDISWF